MIEERAIIIGLITSTEYIERIKDCWTIQLFESKTAKRIAVWVLEYYDKYGIAPGKELETIYYRKKENGNGLPKDLTDEMEESILPGLSEEYENSGVNVDYLVDITKAYFNERNLRKSAEEALSLLDVGKTLEAENILTSYTAIAKNTATWIDLHSEKIKEKLHSAFTRSKEILIKFPGALGEFMNNQLIRGGFVALMGPEKRGKSYWLLEFGMRAVKNKKRVAFFQAGDMDDDDQLIRISTYLTGKAELESNAGVMFQPVKDCIKNQADTCDLKERACHFGLYKKEEASIRKTVTLKELMLAREENKDYIPCTNCNKLNKERLGTVFVEKIDTGDALTEEDAIEAFETFFEKRKREFRISTHSNGSLSVKDIDSILSIWEKEGFIPDVIIIDYADLLIDSSQKEERNRQNQIWKDLRGLNQKRKCLLITATQTDASSYNSDLLTLDNFSEDKRKYGHATAFYGLNQDHAWREKELGIMRINELLKRKGAFSSVNQVHVLQNLSIGRCYIDSYF